jgi:formate dehydrogenase iron-sulfur subunit
MTAAILTDLTRCIGCRACVCACKEINQLPSDDDTGVLTATTWTAIENRNGLNIRRHCMHCREPSCASVCPVGALHKSALGPIIYDEEKCIGCRYFMIGCPFGIPKYEWHSSKPRVRKCIMCYEKQLSRGGQPACTTACPTGATKFGEREALLGEAAERMRSSPGMYVDHIYGVTEAGGTSVLYLSSVPFASLGFRTGVRADPYPLLTWNVLSKLPAVVVVAGVGLAGVWWITRRREEVARHEGREPRLPRPVKK